MKERKEKLSDIRKIVKMADIFQKERKTFHKKEKEKMKLTKIEKRKKEYIR